MRLRPSSGVKKPKSVMCLFQLKINSVEYNVCKKAFIYIFGITMSRLNRLVNCIKSNNPSPKDLRGKHSIRHRSTDNVVIFKLAKTIFV